MAATRGRRHTQSTSSPPVAMLRRSIARGAGRVPWACSSKRRVGRNARLNASRSISRSACRNSSGLMRSNSRLRRSSSGLYVRLVATSAGAALAEPPSETPPGRASRCGSFACGAPGARGSFRATSMRPLRRLARRRQSPSCGPVPVEDLIVEGDLLAPVHVNRPTGSPDIFPSSDVHGVQRPDEVDRLRRADGHARRSSRANPTAALSRVSPSIKLPRARPRLAGPPLHHECGGCRPGT